MKPIPGLSVIIITRNEERDLPDCLASVKDLSSDVVVVDSGSTDETVPIAIKSGAKIFFREWTGYGRQKQAALNEATGPWVLNIDADERVSPELAQELETLLSGQPQETGFVIPFRHYFLGHQLRFGRFREETHLRLYKKDASRYMTQQIHENIEVNGPHGRLQGKIDHYSYATIEEYLDKCNRYTSMIAKSRYEKGYRFHFWHHARLPMEFLVRYILKLGFLDGGAGLTYALLSSYYVWMKFIKLRDMANETKEGSKT